MKDSVVNNLLGSILFDLNAISMLSKDNVTVREIKKVIETVKSIKSLLDNKDNTNTVKRMLYTHMKGLNESNPTRSKEIYNIYQRLKNEIINWEDALEEFARLFES